MKVVTHFKMLLSQAAMNKLLCSQYVIYNFMFLQVHDLSLADKYFKGFRIVDITCLDKIKKIDKL